MSARSWIFTSFVWLSACSSGGGPAPGGPIDALLQGDGGAPDEGAASDLTPAADLLQPGPITLTRFGLVELRAVSIGVPADRHYSTAAAQIYDLGQRNEKCTRSVIAGCLLTQCATTLRPPQQDAGPIRMEGGPVGVTLSFNGGQYLSYSNGGGNNWPVGAPLSVSAPGADVPGFSAMVAMPERVVVRTPERPMAGVNFIVQRTADMTLIWEGGGRGTLWFVATIGAETLECGLQARDGRGVIPALALGKMPSGSGTLTLFTADTREVPAGAHLLRVRAAYSAVGHDGQEFQAQLALF